MTINEKIDQEAEDHRRDYADQEAFRCLRVSLKDFLDDPPRRLWPRTKTEIEALIDKLEKQEQQVTLAWN